MSFIPIHFYPGGEQIDPPENATFRWIVPLEGEQLSGPLEWGAIRPDGKLAHHGIATQSDSGQINVEYYYAGAIPNPHVFGGNPEDLINKLCH